MPKEEKSDLNNENLPEELVSVLKDLVEQYEKEDSWIRKQQVKLWKKNEEFWHGVQYIFWSESRQDWISPAETRWFQQEEGREEAEGPFYDYVINIYKAHGEAVIAALGAQTPAVRFPPDDAEDPEDLVTSKTFAKIADLIQRHNQSKILSLRALFTMANQGIVAAYHAPRSDKAFGMVEIPEFEQNAETGEQEMVGSSKKPKSRTIVQLYGGLNVKVPYYCAEQREFPYLLCNTDHNLSFLKFTYSHVAEKLDEEQPTDAGQYEKMARTPSAFSSWSRVDDNQNLRTLRRMWFRPWVFDGLPKEKEAEKKKLKKMFPTGCYVAFIGRTYVESRDEEMDKYWTIGQCGLSRHIHCDPFMQPLIPVQEMTNVLSNLTLETIEQAIPSTFADTDVLNFNAYSRHEARPGMVYPAHTKQGQRLGDGFYEQGRAMLSKEVESFAKRLDTAGQFVTGSFPSVFGGPSEGKSRTAAEYNMSRQMALQRLGLIWAFFTYFWCKMIEKCVRLYIDSMVADEHFVLPGDSKSQSNYVNVWIRRAEMQGNVGEVEPEGAESFPISTPQKQELLMRLIQMNNAFLEGALFDPENRHLVADALAFPDLYIPGESQRVKQVREIQEMVATGQFVPPEPPVDDDAIHASVIKNWAVGDTGLDVKKTNPQGYALVMQHLMMHEQVLEQKTMQAFATAPPGQPPPHNEEMAQ